MDLTSKIKAILRKNLPDFRAVLSKRYPSFVYGDDTAAGKDEIPIFVFHEIEARDLESKLNYLKCNGYQTLTSSEWMECLKDDTSNWSRRVLLTFDDGHISLWKHTYPLLKKFNFKVISFICPYLVPDSGKQTISTGQRKLCNWEEIQEMHSSGLVDFQAHSLRHDLVFSSSNLIGFYNPKFVSQYAGKKDQLLVLQNEESISFTNLWPYENCQSKDFFGLPIFDLRPRLLTDKRFELSPKIIKCALDFVKNSGKYSFFKQKDWRAKLTKEISRFSGQGVGRLISEIEIKREIADDFKMTRIIIENKLPNKKIKHFCAPWFRVSETSLKIAAEYGYVSAFLGEDAYESNSCNNLKKKILKIPRISENYLYCLPGKGRKKIKDIYLSKFKKIYNL